MLPFMELRVLLLVGLIGGTGLLLREVKKRKQRRSMQQRIAGLDFETLYHRNHGDY